MMKMMEEEREKSLDVTTNNGGARGAVSTASSTSASITATRRTRETMVRDVVGRKEAATKFAGTETV